MKLGMIQLRSFVRFPSNLVGGDVLDAPETIRFSLRIGVLMRFESLPVGVDVLDAPPLGRQNPLATFLFDTIGAKRKVIKKETPRMFRALLEEEVASNFPYASHTARRLTQPPLRHLLKKVDENFHTVFVRTLMVDERFSHRGQCEFLRFSPALQKSVGRHATQLFEGLAEMERY